MASTQKTNYLRLNHWSGTDIPKRQDFINDNMILDQTIGSHMEDMQTHLNARDREKLNSIFFTETYVGDGAENRVITLKETPSFVILYPINYPMGKTEFQGELHLNNFGFTVQGTGSYGLSLNGATLSVKQNSVAEYTFELYRFNQKNTAYQIIAFR